MPSPRAVLRDIEDLELDPLQVHVRCGSDGRLAARVPVAAELILPATELVEQLIRPNIERDSEEPPAKEEPGATEPEPKRGPGKAKKATPA